MLISRIYSSCLIIIGLFTIIGCGYKSKSIHSGKIWLDTNGDTINAHGGGILFHNGLYYWFGEHKVSGQKGNYAMVGVHAYSSKNLYDWKNEGIVLPVLQDSLHPLAKGCIIERPKVIYNPTTKKFVMWFHHELKGSNYASALSGIAVANKPNGPYIYLKSVRPNKQQWPTNSFDVHKVPVNDSIKHNYCGYEGCLSPHPDSLNILGRDFRDGQMARDMTLFLDGDKAYHIYSSEENSTIHIAELTPDFLNYTGKYKRLFINRYMEAPAIFKTENNKYYFIASGCTGWFPNAARLAVADSLFGEWKELGNPAKGIDSSTTFSSQGTFVLSIYGKPNKFIFMADRWSPVDAIDGRYIWLPITWKNNEPEIYWKAVWELD
ncbi:MAG: glycoside hydrolase family 43 protein [Salibacteraceae bacterium]